MADTPDFLPPLLNLDGTYEEIVERLYAVFHRDFIERRANHLGRNVTFNRAIDERSQGKVNGFWHVVEREDPAGAIRLLDHDRAKRLPWAKPIMENPHRKEIKFFFYEEADPRKRIRHYIWLEKYQYVVILQRKPSYYVWVTAFYVDSWKTKDLQKRYERRIGP
jgi:hypothetical protein